MNYQLHASAAVPPVSIVLSFGGLQGCSGHSGFEEKRESLHLSNYVVRPMFQIEKHFILHVFSGEMAIYLYMNCMEQNPSGQAENGRLRNSLY